MILQESQSYVQRIYPVGQPFLPDADLYLASFGQFESRGNFRWEQVASNVVIHAVAKGRGTVRCNGKLFEAGQGDLFVFRTGNTYTYYDHPSDPWQYTFFGLGGDKAEDCMGWLGLDKERPVLAMPFSNPFWIKLQQLNDQVEKQEIDAVSMIRVAWEIIELIKRGCEQSVPFRQESLAAVARQLIEASPQSITNVNELAEALNVSRVTLFRCFKERYNLSVKAYMEQVRFSRIEPLLKNTDLTVSEVARMGGFADPLYFNRAFRKRYGMPPGLWRTMMCK